MGDIKLLPARNVQYSYMRLKKCDLMSVVDPKWETVDPNPDVQALFLQFNDTYFWGKLLCIEVKWSPRMTLCAGVCSYEGNGGLCSIRLSTPLLKLRPRKDLVETLLHEMIHAFLFLTENDRDRDGHGPNFQKHMHRINKASGSSITIYHTFHREVNSYRQHWWRCNGACRSRPPFYGYVKRSMNRAPSKQDFWWEEHAKTCGGRYTKIKEPDGYGVKKKKRELHGKRTTAILHRTDGNGNTVTELWKHPQPVSSPDHHGILPALTNSRDGIRHSSSGNIDSSSGTPVGGSNHLSTASTVRKKCTAVASDGTKQLDSWLKSQKAWNHHDGCLNFRTKASKDNQKYVDSDSVSGVNAPSTIVTGRDDVSRVGGYVLGSGGGVLGSSGAECLSWLAKARKTWSENNIVPPLRIQPFCQTTVMADSNFVEDDNDVSYGELTSLSSTSHLKPASVEVAETPDTNSKCSRSSEEMDILFSYDSFHVSSCDEDTWPTPQRSSQVTEDLNSNGAKGKVSSDFFSQAMTDNFTNNIKQNRLLTASKKFKPDQHPRHVHSPTNATSTPSVRNSNMEVDFEEEGKPPKTTFTSGKLKSVASTSFPLDSKLQQVSRVNNCSPVCLIHPENVVCPVCRVNIPSEDINEHLDMCLL